MRRVALAVAVVAGGPRPGGRSIAVPERRASYRCVVCRLGSTTPTFFLFTTPLLFAAPAQVIEHRQPPSVEHRVFGLPGPSDIDARDRLAAGCRAPQRQVGDLLGSGKHGEVDLLIVLQLMVELRRSLLVLADFDERAQLLLGYPMCFRLVVNSRGCCDSDSCSCPFRCRDRCQSRRSCRAGYSRPPDRTGCWSWPAWPLVKSLF